VNKYLVQLLWCLLVSAGVWLVLNLSLSYVSLVSVPVVAESNIDGRANQSTSDATITAQVRASGFRHASMADYKKRAVKLYIDPEDLKYVGEDYYEISNSDLYKYASSIFGEGVTVESFITESSKFAFSKVTNKKVPVYKVHTVSFADQHMALGEMEIVPDSVYVYGEASRLENIEMIRTRPVNLSNLSSSAHGKVKLDGPVGVRLSDSEVVYSMEVTRYVEISETVKLEYKNVPANVNFEALPSTIDVTFRSVFPAGVNPAKRARFYVDYKDYVNSITGRCIVKSENVPGNVINYNMRPEVVDCLVNVR